MAGNHKNSFFPETGDTPAEYNAGFENNAKIQALQALQFDTLADALNSELLEIGTVVEWKERVAGHGGGCVADVVDINSVAVNGFDVIEINSEFAFVIRQTSSTYVASQYGAITGLSDFSNEEVFNYISSIMPDRSTLHIDGNFYNLSGTFTFTNKNLCTLDSGNATFYYEGSESAIVVDAIRNSTINIGNITSEWSSDGSLASEGVPLELKCIVGSTINVFRIDEYVNGILINPKGDEGLAGVDGFYYNNVTIKHIGGVNLSVKDCLTITTTTGTLPSYVNENVFTVQAMKSYDTGIRFVKGVGQVDPFNGNYFLKCGFEYCQELGIYVDYARNNRFVSPRFEQSEKEHAFWQGVIIETVDCDRNIYDLSSQHYADLHIDKSNNSIVTGLLLDSGYNIITDKITYTKGTQVVKSDYLDVNPSELPNNSKFINGLGANLSQGKPFEKFAGFIKDENGVVEPYGEIAPYDYMSIQEYTQGDVVDVGNNSIVRLSWEENSSGDIFFKTSSSKEMLGNSFIFEHGSEVADVHIVDSSDVEHISPVVFNGLGTYLISYHSYEWRAVYLGGVSKTSSPSITYNRHEITPSVINGEAETLTLAMETTLNGVAEVYFNGVVPDNIAHSCRISGDGEVKLIFVNMSGSDWSPIDPIEAHITTRRG